MSSTAQPYLLKLEKGSGVVQIFLPHEIYAKMTENTDLSEWCLSNDMFDNVIGHGPLLKNCAQHDAVRFEGDLSQVGMVGVHCDGVSYTTTIRAGGSKAVLVASMNVISATCDKKKKLKQPLFVVRKGRLCDCGCGGYCSLQEIFGVISWSMQCLLRGRSPSSRHDGSAWTREDLEHRMPRDQDIPQAALTQIRGDWEWLESCFRIRSVNAQICCWMCDTTKSPGPNCFHDFTPTAAHRATAITHEQYITACAVEGQSPSTILRSPGARMDYLAVDSMHAADLGCFQDALGSLFYLEIDNKQLHRNRGLGMVSLNAVLKQNSIVCPLGSRIVKITAMMKHVVANQ